MANRTTAICFLYLLLPFANFKHACCSVWPEKPLAISIVYIYSVNMYCVDEQIDNHIGEHIVVG